MSMDCRHLFLALLLLALPAVCFSKTETGDSLAIRQHAPDSIRLQTAGEPGYISGLLNPVEYHWKSAWVIAPLFPDNKVADLQTPDVDFTPGQAALFHWKNGAVIATGGTRSFPGLMQIDSGELGIYQSAGDFTFHVGAMVSKYGYFKGLHTQYGLNGSITYRFTPRLSATIFGDYYFGRPPRMATGMLLPPSVIGYYGRSTFGGYVDYQINDHWGVQTGAQAVQQVGTNRYQAEPIVTPYYKINKKVAIGLPVGQILYHILKK